MPKSWTIAYNLSGIWDYDPDEAELTAEVIASKQARQDWKDNMMYGPGMITDVEINLEKIYETD